MRILDVQKGKKMELIQKLGNYGLIPVTVIEKAEQAVLIAKALEDAELPVMEVTLRTKAGFEAIRRVHAEKPEFLLGAGTVLTLEQCKAAVEAGASYIVSPGFREDVVYWCIENKVPVIPGCVTPGEIERALDAGIHVVKFFPASTYGGAAGCKALYGPYASAGLAFIPTGGVGPDNLNEYADKSFIHAVGGGWLTPSDAVRSGDFEKITRTARAAVAQLLGFTAAHIGVNLENSEEAFKVAGMFETAFGWKNKPGNSSVFAGQEIEVLKSLGRGEKGHLAVRTNHVKRALFYLEKRGFKADPESIRESNGRPVFAYLEDEFGGFAVHLLQK